MAKKRIDDVDPGDVLSSDAVDVRGRVLAKAGTTIDARVLRQFKTWGITWVHVGDEDAPEPEEQPLHAEIDEALCTEFAHTDNLHPLIAALMTRRAASILSKNRIRS